MAASFKHYSGIMVVARPGRLRACEDAIRQSGLAEIHHDDPESGRIIAVLETATLEEQPEALRRIRALPDVLLAELVYYLHDLQTETHGSPRMTR